MALRGALKAVLTHCLGIVPAVVCVTRCCACFPGPCPSSSLSAAKCSQVGAQRPIGKSPVRRRHRQATEAVCRHFPFPSPKHCRGGAFWRRLFPAKVHSWGTHLASEIRRCCGCGLRTGGGAGVARRHPGTTTCVGASNPSCPACVASAGTSRRGSSASGGSDGVSILGGGGAPEPNWQKAIKLTMANTFFPPVHGGGCIGSP